MLDTAPISVCSVWAHGCCRGVSRRRSPAPAVWRTSPPGFTCIREADLPQMAAWAAKEANPTYPVPVIYDRARFIRVIRQVMQ